MKRDKTSMSNAVLHMLKMQIKAQANQLRQRRTPSIMPKTPTQKRHFQQQFEDTLYSSVLANGIPSYSGNSLTPSSSKKHFYNVTFTESPHHCHKQRKHFRNQFEDHVPMGEELRTSKEIKYRTEKRVQQPSTTKGDGGSVRFRIDLDDNQMYRQRPSYKSIKEKFFRKAQV